MTIRKYLVLNKATKFLFILMRKTNKMTMKKIIGMAGLMILCVSAFSQDQSQQKPIPIDVKNKSLDVKISNKKIPVVVFNNTVPLNVHIADSILNVHIIESVDSSKKIFSFVRTENVTNAMLLVPKQGYEIVIEYIGYEGVDQTGKLQLATKAFLSYYNHPSVAVSDPPAAQFPVAAGNCNILIKQGNAARINVVLPDELKGSGSIYVYGHQRKANASDYIE